MRRPTVRARSRCCICETSDFNWSIDGIWNPHPAEVPTCLFSTLLCRKLPNTSHGPCATGAIGRARFTPGAVSNEVNGARRLAPKLAVPPVAIFDDCLNASSDAKARDWVGMRGQGSAPDGSTQT